MFSFFGYLQRKIHTSKYKCLTIWRKSPKLLFFLVLRILPKKTAEIVPSGFILACNLLFALESYSSTSSGTSYSEDSDDGTFMAPLNLVY